MGKIVTRVCSFELDSSGLVVATMVPGAAFELADAREAADATWVAAGERRRPVLVDLRNIHSMTRASREFFMGTEVADKMSAVALFVGSPLSRMVANFFLRSGRHRIPTLVFSDEDSARTWLRGFVR